MREKELNIIYKELRLSTLDENQKPMGVNKLSEKINIASSRISELENGKREMSLTELKAYHSFFNVSFEYLLGETEYKSTDMIELSVSERTGLSEEAIMQIQQTPYDGILSDFLETELSEGGVISLIFEYLVNKPTCGERIIISRDGKIRFDESSEITDYNDLFDISEVRTNELYKTIMLNKIISRITYIENTDQRKRVLDSKATHEWRERATKIYVDNEIFIQNYTPTPFEQTELYTALTEQIAKENTDNGKHNTKKE